MGNDPHLLEQSWSCTRERLGPNRRLNMSQLFLTLSSFCTHLKYSSHPFHIWVIHSAPLILGPCLTMHNISEDGIQNYFSNCSTDNLGWGRLGIYLNVANDFPSTSRDERETMHLNFNSPLDSLCQKEHTSNSEKAKSIICLVWGLTVGGVTLSRTQIPASRM